MVSIDRTDLRRYLAGELGLDVGSVEDDTPLFSSGMVDSFALVKLIVWLEDRTGIRVGPLDVTLENLDTVERMLAYVARRHTA
jgi:acyl carrier protein